MEKVNNWLKHSVFIASRLRNAVKKKKKREPISIPVFPEQQNKGLLTGQDHEHFLYNARLNLT
ncbi:hypothetical protein BOO36_17950 [Vibrio navarrensis]|nr:hypothetical protein [Vibrio navarrensis]